MAIKTRVWIVGVCALVPLSGLAGRAIAQVRVPPAAPGAPAAVEAPDPRGAVVAKAPPVALSAELGVGLGGPVPAVTLPPVNVAALLAEDAAQPATIKVLRYGLGRDVVLRQTDGRYDPVPAAAGGGWLWSVDIVSTGAMAVKIHLAGLDLPNGARAVGYPLADPSQVAGPYSGQGPYANGGAWMPTMSGEAARVECYLPGATHPAGPPITIDRVQHVYRDPVAMAGVGGGQTREPACENDVTCFSAWATTARACAGIGFVNQNSLFCSGQMLTTMAADYTPYYLTANHCLSSDQEAQSAEIYWLYQSAVCNATAPTLSSVPHSIGCTLLATAEPSDYTLLMIDGVVPGGVAWAGWTAGVPADGTPAACIHHPQGGPKKISFGNTSPDAVCVYDAHITMDWTSGPTEPGSSGGGVFRSDNHQLFGQLHCGPSACGSVTSDDFGAFAVTYLDITPLLAAGSDDQFEPNNTCAAARAIGPGTYNGLTVKYNNDDWYRITVPGHGRLLVTLAFINAFGDIDTLLQSSCAGPQVAASQGATDGEQISYVNPGSAAADYFLRVYLSDDVRARYNMIIAITDPPPANDSCSAAIVVGDGVYNGTTLQAGADGTCSCGGAAPSPDVWYSYTAACTGTVAMQTCNSAFDTVLSVHTACPGTAANQVGGPGGCNDDATGGPCAGTRQSYIGLPVIAGQRYWIRVSGYNGDGGAYTLAISSSAPANDACASATPVSNGSYPFGTCNATTDGPDEPAGCSFFGYSQIGSDVWFRYTATCTGTATAALCGSSFDTKLAAYGGVCPTTPGGVVACNDDTCGRQSQVTFPVLQGGTYLIRIGGYQGLQGSGTLTISCTRSCRGDFNNDGIVNVNDFLAFLAAYAQGSQLCDFNGDGHITVADFLAYLSAYAAGC
jgi:hypothetical protein